MKENLTLDTSDEDESSKDELAENSSPLEEDNLDESEKETEEAEISVSVQKHSELNNPPAKFEELGVNKWILHQLSGLGISRPSPVQANCIAPILA